MCYFGFAPTTFMLRITFSTAPENKMVKYTKYIKYKVWNFDISQNKNWTCFNCPLVVSNMFKQMEFGKCMFVLFVFLYYELLF